MITVLTIVLAVLLAITSSLLVVLILLHRGKGGGLSAHTQDFSVNEKISS